MIYLPVEQSSAEWVEARLGVPTSSCFDRIVTKTGRPSGSRNAYLCELLAEAHMRRPAKEFDSDWMARGRELEDEAISFFEMQTDMETSPGGFCLTDDGKLGCSPDRLIRGAEGEIIGGLEIKCPSATVHVGHILGFEDVTWKHRLQVQGSMYVTGASWWYIEPYHPDLWQQWVLEKVERDDEFIEAMAKHLRAFVASLDELRAGR